MPLPKLVESFARPGAQQQQTEQKRPVQQQLSAASGRAVEPDEPEAAASESAASAASETKGFRTIPEAAAVSAGVASEQQASQEGSPPVEWPAEQQASQQASLSMGQHAGRSVGEQQPQQQPQRAAPVVAEPRPRPRSPKQRAAWQPLGICLLGGEHCAMTFAYLGSTLSQQNSADSFDFTAANLQPDATMPRKHRWRVNFHNCDCCGMQGSTGRCRGCCGTRQSRLPVWRRATCCTACTRAMDMLQSSSVTPSQRWAQT